MYVRIHSFVRLFYKTQETFQLLKSSIHIPPEKERRFQEDDRLGRGSGGQVQHPARNVCDREDAGAGVAKRAIESVEKHARAGAAIPAGLRKG